MLAREGYRIIAGAIIIAAILIIIALQLGTYPRLFLIALGAVVVLFTLWFFRDPVRTPPAGAAEGTLLIAPADGKVVEIRDVDEQLYIKGPAKQLSIFLSPLNVHVNRIPATGVIEYDNYVAGDYLVAWHPKASELNERSQLGVRHPSGAKILFKQIAGAVARRIEYHVAVGDTVRGGERFGIVKFGSRMDVIVPPHINFDVEVGTRVTAGETILGHLPLAGPGSTVAAAGGASMSAGASGDQE